MIGRYGAPVNASLRDDAPLQWRRPRSSAPAGRARMHGRGRGDRRGASTERLRTRTEGV